MFTTTHWTCSSCSHLYLCLCPESPTVCSFVCCCATSLIIRGYGVTVQRWFSVLCVSQQVAPNYPIVCTNLAVALTDLGTALKLKGQVQQGIAMYERALALVPRHADALYNLGRVHKGFCMPACLQV
jgi:hypothetical protein